MVDVRKDGAEVRRDVCNGAPRRDGVDARREGVAGAFSFVNFCIITVSIALQILLRSCFRRYPNLF